RQQDLAKAEEFWRRSLQGISTPTSLAATLASSLPDPSPGTPTQDYQQQHIQLTVDTTNALKSLARNHQVTLNTLIQGAWALLLSRYSGETDIIFGTTSAGRPPGLAGIQSMVGLFLSTLPVRVQIPSATPLVDWLKTLQTQQAEMRQYEYSPLVQIQSWSEIPPEFPLFESLVVFSNVQISEPPSEAPSEAPYNGSQAPSSDPSLDNLVIQDFSEFEKTNYPLTILVTPKPALSIEIWHDGHHFSAATISRLLQHFQALLESMVNHPHQPLSKLSLLTTAEQQQLVAWNTTQTNQPDNRCIHQRFAEQVERTPDAIAILFENHHLTYHTLNHQANQLAAHLQTLGIGPEQRVGIYMERSIEMVISILAILKAGGAYVPLDPAYPRARLQFMLADAQVHVLLTQAALVEQLPEYDGQVICWENNGERRTENGEQNNQQPSNNKEQDTLSSTLNSRQPRSSIYPSTPFPCPSTPLLPLSLIPSSQNLAYILYTSGSTGTPKGVAMPHGTLVNLINWQVQSHPNQGLRTLQFTPSSFDVSFQELFATWCAGGTLVLISDDLRRDPARILQFLRAEAIERLFLPFVALRQLAEIAVNQNKLPDSLRDIITAGEQLQITQAIAHLLTRLKNCTLYNQYGPSESHVVTAHTLTGPPSTWPLLPAIGHPITHAQIHILDSQLQPTPIGIPGELYIGGFSLARNYWNRPELTAERFVPNPFLSSAGDVAGNVSTVDVAGNISAVLYKTGDLARYHSDGTIEFLGRRDAQVKIRGFRVEPGEIEAVLDSSPAVRDVAVLAPVNEAGDQHLVAYVVLQPGKIAIASDLRAFLSERLPSYMIPTAFVFLETLPLTPSGKLDRRSLPQSAQPQSAQLQPELTTGFVAPRTLTEELLADLWTKTLDLDQIGIHDNFFDRGGHSLLAIRLVSQISNTLQVELRVLKLFEHPTIAELAAYIEELRQAQQGFKATPIQPISRQGELPFSITQYRLWYYNEQVQPNDYFYHTSTGLRIRGQLDISALEQSLNQIIQGHEALRSTVTVVSDHPIKRISPHRPLKLLLIDLQALSARQREVEAQRLAVEVFRRPFDLTQGPLLRAILIRLGQAKYIAQITIHQLAFDAWSRNVLMQELQVLYNAYSTGQPDPLPKRSLQFDDFAHWQRQWLKDHGLQASLAYWQKQLAGDLPVLQLPTDYPRPAVKTFQGATVGLFLPRNLTDALRALSQQEEVTLFMTLFAAYNVWLYCYTQQTDMIIATSAADRIRPEVENLIGSFNNYLMLRSDLSGNPTFCELLQRVRRVALDAYAHQDVPFTELLAALKPEPDLSRTPLFQAMFTYKRFLDRPTQDFQGLTLSPYSVDWSTARCDLTLSLLDDGHDIRGFLEYSTDLFAADTILQWLRHAQIILESLVVDPKQRLSELSHLVEPDPQIETLADLGVA
ncbi:MAG: amino acid adenylation domain-containing protein, partial [Cyanothece sp. SIO1E1]|nr:amino acid adenylation domain-containing protein [Cyanothece sp. SIO1E1]